MSSRSRKAGSKRTKDRKVSLPTSMSGAIYWRDFTALTSAFSCHLLKGTWRRRQVPAVVCMECKWKATNTTIVTACFQGFVICWNDTSEAASVSHPVSGSWLICSCLHSQWWARSVIPPFACPCETAASIHPHSNH